MGGGLRRTAPTARAPPCAAGNGIGAEGAKELAAMLKVNTTLIVLYLSGACSRALPLTLRSCTLEEACGAPPERAPHTPSPRPRPLRPACRRQWDRP